MEMRYNRANILRWDQRKEEKIEASNSPILLRKKKIKEINSLKKKKSTYYKSNKRFRQDKNANMG